MHECQPKILIEIVHRTEVVLEIVQRIQRPQEINPIQSQATAFGDLKFCHVMDWRDKLLKSKVT